LLDYFVLRQSLFVVRFVESPEVLRAYIGTLNRIEDEEEDDVEVVPHQHLYLCLSIVLVVGKKIVLLPYVCEWARNVLAASRCEQAGCENR
jgi:hypothetical protein